MQFRGFRPTEVEKLSEVLEEVSAQIYKETGFYITGLDWLEIFPEDGLIVVLEDNLESNKLFD